MPEDEERLERAHDVPGKVVREIVIPARGHCDLTLSRGQCFRVIDLEGVQVLDYASFSLADPFEEKLSVVWSNFLNKTWKPTAGHILYTNRCNPMYTILEDTVGVHFMGGGYCCGEANFRRYGVEGTRSCAENLMEALEPHGFTRGRIDDGACFTFFLNVSYDPDGTFEIRPTPTRPGDYTDLRAEMDVLAGISNCPQENNPGTGFHPSPMKIIVYEG
ncbi:MAG: DUF1989 domain-containing protein [Nitrospinota bacterium]